MAFGPDTRRIALAGSVYNLSFQIPEPCPQAEAGKILTSVALPLVIKRNSEDWLKCLM